MPAPCAGLVDVEAGACDAAGVDWFALPPDDDAPLVTGAPLDDDAPPVAAALPDEAPPAAAVLSDEFPPAAAAAPPDDEADCAALVWRGGGA